MRNATPERSGGKCCTTVRGCHTSAWAAPLAGSAGGVLVVAAVVLWRGPRERHEEF